MQKILLWTLGPFTLRPHSQLLLERGKIKHKHSKREHFSSSPYDEPQASARRPAARNNSTPRHTGAEALQARWIIDTIKLAYSSLGQLCPMRVRAHSTRGIASSWAWSSSVSIAEICAAAGWALPSTFARFYNLEVPALQAWSFLLNWLTLSHDNQYGCLPSSVRSWPSFELRGCTDLFETITQGWVNLDKFDPLTFCRAALYNTWSLWARGRQPAAREPHAALSSLCGGSL